MIKEKQKLMIEGDLSWGSSGKVTVSVMEHTGTQGEGPEGLQAVFVHNRPSQNGDRHIFTQLLCWGDPRW